MSTAICSPSAAMLKTDQRATCAQLRQWTTTQMYKSALVKLVQHVLWFWQCRLVSCKTQQDMLATTDSPAQVTTIAFPAFVFAPLPAFLTTVAKAPPNCAFCQPGGMGVCMTPPPGSGVAAVFCLEATLTGAEASWLGPIMTI